MKQSADHDGRERRQAEAQSEPGLRPVAGPARALPCQVDNQGMGREHNVAVGGGQDRGGGSKVKGNIEGARGALPLHRGAQEHEVRGGGYRQEFRQSLDGAEEGRLTALHAHPHLVASPLGADALPLCIIAVWVGSVVRPLGDS